MKHQYNLRLDPILLDRIRSEAVKRDTTVTQLITDAIETKLATLNKRNGLTSTP